MDIPPPPSAARRAPAGRLQIGPWEADAASNELRVNGAKRRLEPKTMQVLFCLAEKPGEVVGREELLASVWPGVVVGDEVLTQAVIKLRKALGDHAHSPTAIETIPKRGYRLLAPVTRPEAPSAPPTKSVASHRAVLAAAALSGLVLLVLPAYLGRTPDPAPPAVQSQPSQHGEHPTLTVMPFESSGEAAVPPYLARGIAADLSADLSKVGQLRVISTPPLAGGGAAPQAGARYLITGRLQRAGGRLRVGLWLFDTRTGDTLWSERFERPFADLPDLQEEIVRRLTALLPVQVSEAERRRIARRHTRNYAAYDHFQRGQALVTVRRAEENEQAKRHYRSAIYLDPKFAHAYAGLALAYAADYRHQWAKNRAQAAARALEMADTAWQIDPDIPAIYWVRAYVHSVQHRFDEARTDLEQAFALDRSYADAYALMGAIETWSGQPARGIPQLRTALRLNPQGGYLYFQALGRAYLLAGDAEQAVINLREALFRNPAELESRVNLVAALAAAGERDAALWEAEEVRALEPQFSTRQWLGTHPMADRGQRQRIAGLLEGAGLR